MAFTFKFFLCFTFTLWIQSSFAGAYECVDKNGNTAFQSRPCPTTSKETKIKQRTQKKDKTIQCKSVCDSEHLVCVSTLDNGTWNTDGGISVCDKEYSVCKIACDDPQKAKVLKLSAKYKRSMYNIDKKYEKKAENRQKKYRLKKEKECRTAKSNHRKATKNWENLGRRQKERMSKIEKKHYLNEISTAKEALNNKC